MSDIVSTVSQELADEPEPDMKHILLAFLSLTMMACFSITIGAFRSVSCLQKQKFTGKKVDNINLYDAIVIPFMGIFYMAVIYACDKVFSQVYVNTILNLVSLAFGVFSLPHFLSPFLAKIVQKDVRRNIILVHGTEVISSLCLGTADILAFVSSSIILGVILRYKLWFLHNIFVIAFAVQCIEMLHLNNFFVCFLLMEEVNLFYYILYALKCWKKAQVSVGASAYLLFPLDLFEKWPDNERFLALGVGEIIIIGMFLAHLLRFDMWLKRGQKLYFYSCFTAYLFGYAISLIDVLINGRPGPVMPFCIFTCICTLAAIVFIKGDVDLLEDYLDHPDRPHPLDARPAVN